MWRGGVFFGAALAALFLGILSMPVAIIYKINLFGVDFGISYLLFLVHMTFFWGHFLFSGCWLSSIRWRVLFIVAIVALLLAVSILKAAHQSIIITLVLLLFSILMGVVASEKNYRSFYIMFSWLYIFAIAIGVVFYYFNIPIYDLDFAGGDNYFLSESGRYRAASLFMNPNAFGYFLVFYVCYYTCNLDFFRNRILSILTLTFAIVGLWMSESRSAQLSLCLVGLLWIVRIFFFRLKTSLIYTIYFLLFCAAALFICFMQLFQDENIRVVKWLVGEEIWMEGIWTFLFGVPFGRPLEQGWVSFSDNMFLFFLYRYGVVGLILFISLGFSMLRGAVSCFSRSANPFVAGCGLFVMSSFVPMFFSNYLNFMPIPILFGLASGVCANYRPKI